VSISDRTVRREGARLRVGAMRQIIGAMQAAAKDTMRTDSAPATTVDAYIAAFPEAVQAVLEKVRLTIRQAAPDAQECISYRIPTFRLNGSERIYFAGYRRHIGLYPVPADSPRLRKEIARYGAGKASLRFPLDQPIPFELITKIVQIKLEQGRAGPRATAQARTNSVTSG
jgi:uncharacterized protein YdhG (YjbR/CyaY superfamily)